MTKPIDWDALIGPKPTQKAPGAPNVITVVDLRNGAIPMEIAYGRFHDRIDSSASGARLVENILDVRGDQDRLVFAEQYAEHVLDITDMKDAMWFRRGVMLKENIPSTRYPRQRDHTIHTLHNYFLGWYLFINSPKVAKEFRKALLVRGIVSKTDKSIIFKFGELWCFASLLHDIGYLFEGEIPKQKMALVDQGIREGMDWVSEYFHELFWKEWNLRGVDERRNARALFEFDGEPTLDGGAGRIIHFLRDLGTLENVQAAIVSETGDTGNLPKLSPDAFRVWELNYRSFGQPQMAERIKGLEEALYSVSEDGIPGSAVRVLDHGICGGLLLLKFSTYWFRAFFALKKATPSPGSVEAELQDRMKSQVGWPSYRAAHWWRSVVWATAAVALHNVQQSPNFPGWKEKLELSEDPLAYLGVLVDVLQEWDRHSTRKVTAVESDERMINSNDVRIGHSADGKIYIQYGCRDGKAAERQQKITAQLDMALADWDQIVEISCQAI